MWLIDIIREKRSCWENIDNPKDKINSVLILSNYQYEDSYLITDYRLVVIYDDNNVVEIYINLFSIIA